MASIISTPSTVSVQITSSMTSFTSEKRLQRGDAISTLKVKKGNLCLGNFLIDINLLQYWSCISFKQNNLNRQIDQVNCFNCQRGIYISV